MISPENPSTPSKPIKANVDGEAINKAFPIKPIKSAQAHVCAHARERGGAGDGCVYVNQKDFSQKRLPHQKSGLMDFDGG